jgi:DNA-binding transcriptional MerR regulator
LETPAHVLRFWESRFPQIKPVKRAGGRRYYRPADVALLTGIKRLLHDEGMTIRGVQKILREQGVRHVSGLTDEPSPEEEALEAAMLGRLDAEDAPPPDEAEEATAAALRGRAGRGRRTAIYSCRRAAPRRPRRAARQSRRRTGWHVCPKPARPRPPGRRTRPPNRLPRRCRGRDGRRNCRSPPRPRPPATAAPNRRPTKPPPPWPPACGPAAAAWPAARRSGRNRRPHRPSCAPVWPRRPAAVSPFRKCAFPLATGPETVM